MGGLVQLQALGVAEALAAGEAGVHRPLLVGLAVEVEALVGNEHLVADGAAVALLPLVDEEVAVQLLLAGEAVPAEPACEGLGPRVHAVVRPQVPLQGKRLFAVRAAVLVPALVDLLVEDEAHQGGVELPAPPALVGLLALVAPLVGLQVGLLVEAAAAVGAVDHLPARVGGAAVDGPAGGDLRVVLCGGDRGQAQLLQRRTQTRQMGGAWSVGGKGPPAGGWSFSSEFSPRDRKSRPSSQRRQSVSLMDTFLRTG